MSELHHYLRSGFGYHLLQLARQWRRFDEKAMLDHGYTDVSWVPLLHLYGAEPMMQKELAARCGLDTSSLVRLLNPLTERGLLDRRPNPADGRAWLLQLTDQGQTEASRIAEIVYQTESAMLRDVPTELIDAFIQAAGLIEDNIDDLQHEAGNA